MYVYMYMCVYIYIYTYMYYTCINRCLGSSVQPGIETKPGDAREGIWQVSLISKREDAFALWEF